MGELSIYEPEENDCDLQAKRNRELDSDTISRLIQNFTAAYNETSALGADYWKRQGSTAVSQVQRFGI